jgi:ribosome maturation protein Sdo1
MPRGEGDLVKVHFKGSDDDYIVMAESVEAVNKWKEDKSIPLVDVVDSFDIFVTHKQGTQGVLDRASKSSLENEFGSSKEDDVVKQILERGEVQESKVRFEFYSICPRMSANSAIRVLVVKVKPT